MKWIGGAVLTIVTGLIVNIISDKLKDEKPVTVSVSKDTVISPYPNHVENNYYTTTIPSNKSQVSEEVKEPATTNWEKQKAPNTIEVQPNTLPEVPSCQTNRTGTFVFKNNTEYSLHVFVYQTSIYNSVKLTLPPGTEKNTGELQVGYQSYQIINPDVKDQLGYNTLADEGKILIEQCKTGRYEINKVMIPKIEKVEQPALSPEESYRRGLLGK